ncbi:unnamed protein product, partial [Effrenium voratum]
VKSACVDAVMDDCAEMSATFACLQQPERLGLGLEACVERAQQSAKDTVAPRYLDHFERALREAPYGWVAKTKYPSIADFAVACHLRQLFGLPLLKGLDMSRYPQIMAHIDKVIHLDFQHAAG